MDSQATKKAIGTRPTALIVDDDRDTREMYAYYLSAEGINTVEAEDGMHGLAKATATLPDIIATDLRLPRMDGVQLCRSLKQQERTQNIPIIAVTGGSPGDIAAAQQAGCISVLLKPCLPETFLAEIKRILAATVN
jgi:two-component system, cell cycle response regulator DivK